MWIFVNWPLVALIMDDKAILASNITIWWPFLAESLLFWCPARAGWACQSAAPCWDSSPRPRVTSPTSEAWWGPQRPERPGRGSLSDRNWSDALGPRAAEIYNNIRILIRQYVGDERFCPRLLDITKMEDEWNWMKWRLREIKECHYHYLEGMMYQSLGFGHYPASSASSIEAKMCVGKWAYRCVSNNH